VFPPTDCFHKKEKEREEKRKKRKPHGANAPENALIGLFQGAAKREKKKEGKKRTAKQRSRIRPWFIPIHFFALWGEKKKKGGKKKEGGKKKLRVGLNYVSFRAI